MEGGSDVVDYKVFILLYFCVTKYYYSGFDRCCVFVNVFAIIVNSVILIDHNVVRPTLLVSIRLCQPSAYLLY